MHRLYLGQGCWVAAAWIVSLPSHVHVHGATSVTRPTDYAMALLVELT